MIARFALAGRQWRRMLLGAALMVVFMVICLSLDLIEMEEDLLASPIGWVALALTGLIVSIGLLFTFALLAPGLLSLIELWGIALVVTALLTPAWSTAKTAFNLPGWLDCAFLVAAFLLVHKALYGDWQRRMTGQRTRSTKRSVRLKARPDAVWRALRPDPDRPGDHYWPGVSFLPTPEGESGDFLMIRPRRAGLKDETTIVTVTDDRPGEGFTVSSRPAFESEAETPEITLNVEIHADPKGGTRLTVEEHLRRFTMGQRLAWWLSDDLSDHLSCMRARIDGRSDGSIHGLQMLRPHQIGGMSPPARPA